MQLSVSIVSSSISSLVKKSDEQNCSSNEKTKCSHIFAVLSTTGISIENSIKMPKMANFAKLVETKNGGKSGRKNRPCS